MKKAAVIFSLFTSALTAQTDAFILDIEKSLMAPCCWSGTVYDPGNAEMEEEIKSLVSEGQTKESILDYFVNKKRIVLSDGRIRYGYGEKILAIPTASGFNLLAWIMPAALGIAAISVIGLTMKQRSKSQKPAQSDSDKIDNGIPYEDEIEKELAELD